MSYNLNDYLDDCLEFDGNDEDYDDDYDDFEEYNRNEVYDYLDE